ncbi:MAG: hypothetical protein WC804_12960 [Sphingomonas sp.]
MTDPIRFDDAIATGENTLRRQGQLAGKGEGEIAYDVAAWQSRRYVDAVHALAPSDGLGATALFERYRDQLTPADRAALEPLLREPMAQTQAIADIDTPALAAAPFAPLTPQGDPLLADRMRTITPHFDRVVLPELMQRYGGDAARAWAATQIGTDAVDALVKQHGDGWYQALPAAARYAVAHNFALLNAGSSARAAPQDRAAVEASLAGLDDTRRGYAQRELALRTSRADQARRAAQGAAADQAYELADRLGHDFTSLAQLPARVRADLSDQTSAALQRQADANIDPQPVAPEGAVSLALRNMATTAPEAFRDLDLREYRPLVSADEYAMFKRLQRGISTSTRQGLPDRAQPRPTSQTVGLVRAAFNLPTLGRGEEAEQAGAPAMPAPAHQGPGVAPPADEDGASIAQLENWIASLSDDAGGPARATESNDNSAKISTGAGDAGGPSYGSYQLAQNRGQVPQFLAKEGAPWAKELAAAPIYSEEFKAIWKKIARREGQKFKDAENAFALRTKFDPVLLEIGKVLHFNLSTRSVAVRAAVIAAANHMGPGGPTLDNGGYGVVRKAIMETDQSISRDDADYDRQLVDNIYEQRKAILLRMADRLIKKSEDLRLPPAKRAEAKKRGINLRNSARNVFTNERQRVMSILDAEKRKYPEGF